MANTRTIEVSYPQLVTLVDDLRRKHGKASVTDVADHLGTSRSTAHRRLQEAVEDGWLVVLGPGGYASPPEG